MLLSTSNQVSTRPIVYAVTTNGTLLTDDMVDFLVHHRFHVAVSLDGDQANHDRNRIGPLRRGSFDGAMSGLRKFRDRHPSYSLLHLAATVDWATDLYAIEEFFTKHSWLPKLQRVGLVFNRDTQYYEQFSAEQRRRFRSQLADLNRRYRDAVVGATAPSPFQSALFETAHFSVVCRSRHGNLVSPLLGPAGKCAPGTKIAVDVDGHFDICERVNGSRHIGDIDSGLDIDEVGAVLRDYSRGVGGACAACPITRLCSQCLATTNAGRGFRLQGGECERMIGTTARLLQDTVSILEEAPDAFRKFSFIDPVVRFLNS